ncbi:penicillin acylase family protein [Pseudomonas sp. RTC3]|uniref:penicillin acylase family protein n=1 Tax=unclassified Pseudomonas TaxID=196821 RepID=UPI002AB4FF91|nr:MULTISPECIES: penicillin acylase family protein [unclassified Pseudomonas]MEB0064204.1 penicillin acylase family protein [Pseudomonas sp. RTC3]MDY7566161.1 penicillin acylase family protein [Pseudomonas sp. 5C2]MEB0005703.1 penicillin acylase family protein [Pseudomonas sp. RTB2]MEB0016777.1 penicillin acylase family protein [Pseudomonas sp. RTB3]MEB0239151.1 penicillin acylase family protein [Pseudomonas sp. 5C2]
MASPALSYFLPRFGVAAAVAGALSLAGCQLNGGGSDTLPPTSGVYPLKGLAQNVSVRRNNLGMPLIESSTFHDALFTLGYVHASDRISQMVGMRLLAQGRLSEMDGPSALEIDRLMRSINLKKSASELYNGSSPRLKRFFEVYARGVNAYLFRYRDKLPADLAASGYHPEYWKPEDSALIFSLLNFGVSKNLQEELSSLVLAQKVGADKLAWLIPTYPDEELPFAEAEKLKGLNLGQVSGLSDLNRVASQLSDLNMLGVAAANNWAISPRRSRSGKSLMANDIHQSAKLPSAWNFVQIRAPKYQAAGVSIAGLPLVMAGFNGKLAWSMTGVMGDNQDLFLEKLKRENNKLFYMADGKWQPATVRNETFFVKGERPVRETIYETRHGPLLNSALGERTSPQQPVQLNSGFGLALQTPDFKDDKSMDALFNLSRAQNVEKASDASREIRAIALNMVFADAQNIGWQVTGRFPNRREGLGLLPSPGWDSRFDWDGFADPMLHPYDQDPVQGWIGTANQRTVPKGYGMQLSNSWNYPERAERIAEMAGSGKQDTRSMIAMQYDQTTTFAAKLKKMFETSGMAQSLKQAIEALPATDRAKAHEALTRLLAFDGKLSANSADAALYELFLQESAKQIFLDELGPETSPAWKALVESANLSYSAQADHLLGREDSPYWDDTRTPQKEDKPTILARSLAAAITAGESQLGNDHKAWQWGKLHHYAWTSEGSRRSPIPAGGDHSTLNESAYNWGQDFDTRLIPAMRFIVDFGQQEPMIGQSTGQSGNPASPHYADGIDPWLKGQYMSIPMQPQNFDKTYGKQRLTLIPGK